ncbi:MBG domain-containing protein [Myroides sp. N17-2]|uniref:MBG domain-containing protein n=1 Tax=Myroides sp. N17-2 TaxID=2030799 RepID=UPI0020B15FF1|nr:MBG domain-containing protein [Myroides sp. N17-2]
MLFAQTSIEVFETESNASASFTDNGVIFNIISKVGLFDIQANFPGTGWNGTANDNRYIDNSNDSSFPPSFSIKTTSNLFKVNRFWVYLSALNLDLSVAGSLTVVGKLSGVTKFMQTKTSGFATALGMTNGYTLIDLTNLNGQNYSNIIIDELELTANGGYRYFGLDAFTWVKDSNIVKGSDLTATISGTNISCYRGTNGTAKVEVSGGKAPYTYSWLPSGGTAATATGLAAGVYTVTIKDADNYTTAQSFTITQPTALKTIGFSTDVSCKGGANGTATVIASGGTPPYTYSWSPSGGTAATATVLSKGTYTVTITDANACTATQSVTITEPAEALTAITAQTNVSCNGGANGTATVIPSGGTAPYTYSWTSSGGTAATATGLSAGTYTVTITDANTCQITKTVTITQPDPIIATTSQTNVSCFGGSNGSATVTPSGGTGNYTYLWSNGATTQTITGLKVGTYEVTVTDANVCQIIRTFTITQPPILLATTAQTNISCNGESTGLASVNPSGGTAPYSYLWSTGATTSSITGLTAGTYTVTIEDGNGCQIMKTFTITQPTALTATTVQVNVSCNGGANGTASVTPSGGAGGYSYLWNTGATTSKISDQKVGTYTVTITDANKCSIKKEVTITGPTAITATIKQTDVSCNGGANGTSTVIASGGTPPYTYSWFPSGGTAATATGLRAGTYTVTITDANQCQIAVKSTITEPTVLNTAIASTIVSCNGGANGSASAIVSGGTAPYAYFWSTGATTQTITGLTAGSYEVTVTDANSCTKSQRITITEPKALTATMSQTNVSCFGHTNGTATVSVSGGTPPYIYSWSPSGGTAATAVGLKAGNYTVTITDANKCSIEKEVTITGPTAITATTSQTNVLCNGGSNGVATVTPLGGTGSYTYLWNNGATTRSITGLTAGTYEVTVTDTNLCQITKTFNITQPTVITTTPSQTNVSCNGGANGTASVNVLGGMGGYTYKWSPSGGTAATATGLTAGTYIVTITDANGCSATQSFKITEPREALKASLVSQTNVSCNGGSNGSATVIASGGTNGYKYSWAPSGGTAATATGLIAGNYTVTVTDANGCTTTESVTITQPTALTTIGFATNVSCSGGTNGTATVIPSGGTGGYTYSWAPSGGTAAKATGLTAGSYIVTVTDANGCTTTQSVTIIDGDVVTKPITETSLSYKYGDAPHPLSAISLNGNKLNWYTEENGTLSKVSLIAPTPSTSKVGQQVYYVSQVNQFGCESPLEKITVTIGAVPLTVTVKPQSMVYGAVDPKLDYVVSGLVNNDKETAVLTGSLSRAKGEDVGSYAITQGDLKANDNYTLEFTGADMTITPAKLSVTTNTQSKVYGATDPKLDYTVSGLQFTDKETDVLTGSLSRAKGENVGSYIITQGALIVNSNYALDLKTANLTITSAKLTVTVNPQSKVYGAVDPKLDYVVSGLVNNDKETDVLTGSLSRALGENVASYAIGKGTLKTNDNYTLEFTGANLTIGTAPLIVTANPQSKVYGAIDSKLDYTVSGLQLTDKETAVLTGSLSRAKGENVGSYIITQSDLKANGNYTLDYKTANLTIGKAPLIVTATTQSKVYGAVDPKLEYTVSGLVNNDKETAVLTGSLSRAIGEDVGTYVINQGALIVNSNYTLDFKTAKLTITSAKLTVTASVKTKVYGAVDPKLDYTVSGLVNNDKETAVLTGSLSRAKGENVGTYVITQGALIVNSNYVLDFKTANLTITSAKLTVTANPQSKVYGAVDPKLDYVVSGLVNNDKETDVLSGSLSRITGENVGVYAINQNDLKANSNYTVDFKTANLTIGTAPLTVTANKQSKVYGAVDPKLDYVVLGLVNNDKETAVLSGGLSRAKGENVGTYAITQGDLKANSNYILNFKTANLTIGTAPLTVTANKQSKVYGAFDPELDYTVSGLQFTDKETAVLTGGLSRATGEDVGSYTINQNDLKANSNYALDFKTANLTIGTALLTVTANKQSKVYGAVDPKLDYVVSGLVNNDKETAVLSGGLSRAIGENVGSYAITQGDLKANGNYSLSYVSNNLVITPATISGLSLTDAIYTYDGTERTLILKGNLPSDMQVSYTANKQTEAGVYQITALVTGANYKDLTLMAKLTITKAKQHIEFDKLSPVIYNTNFQLQLSAVSSSGLPITYSSGDEVGVAIVDPLGLVKILKPGSIVITAQQAGNNNYEPAQNVSQVLLVQNDEADIEWLSINGSDMGKMSSNEYFIIDCEDIDSQVSIALKTSAGANVSTGNNFVIRTPKAGIYRQEIIVKSQSEKASKKYVIEIERPFVFDEIVTQKFNNTLIANNNPLTNGGYTFTGYRWFRNGQLIGTGQIYSVGNNKEDLLDRDALYSVELTTDKGEVLHSCSSTVRYSNTNSIKLYPNPIVKQGELEIAIDYPDSSLKGVTASIYSVTGQFLFKTVLQERISKVVLPYTLVEGSYIMIIKIDGKNKTFRFIVKPN